LKNLADWASIMAEVEEKREITEAIYILTIFSEIVGSLTNKAWIRA